VCSKCDWRAAFSRDELIASHGATCAMPSLLNELAKPGCTKFGNHWDHRGLPLCRPDRQATADTPRSHATATVAFAIAPDAVRPAMRSCLRHRPRCIHWGDRCLRRRTGCLEPLPSSRCLHPRLQLVLARRDAGRGIEPRSFQWPFKCGRATSIKSSMV
jgi:hypothetical protein